MIRYQTHNSRPPPTVQGAPLVVGFQATGICYKVVVSRYNSDPTHLDSGWLYTIYGNNAADRTDVVVDNSKVYNDGDFGKYLVPGYKYYFRVVAVYQNDVIKGSNVLRLEYRGPRN